MRPFQQCMEEQLIMSVPSRKKKNIIFPGPTAFGLLEKQSRLLFWKAYFSMNIFFS